ncbi:DUF4148 domain-containing protein [Hydrogenophaga sp.]|uniref:DUF4148 domain-containing protein n=1 Tax=Hydrogenophaga sp. TaxID=1904254 RepID=UPI0027316248|nr:DUF4148 domain-containing protein [Hydrogenophaga sp.]MDP2405840.1 DUF4148 domain-containing protein [Hydrogenophaga sp.]MDP3886122.1 DUF4148 domain-containing protein [Hydrogenophaga sp.]MDZ4173038.1 DUF4148 domain-containing protein [Hydrogenophaga sp.]
MKTLIVAGLLAITSVAALAESGNGETWGHNVASSGPSLTRAQVVAELREAQANNTIAYGEHASKHTASPSVSVLTRRQVRDEVLALRKAGQLPVHGERSPGDYSPGQL